MATTDLKPTVWRTMRVLANETRLRLLRAVLRSPGRCVRELALQAGVSPNLATIQLRHLQARGLIRAERVSRWVRYTADPDPLVVHAADILAAMRDALSGPRPNYKDVIACLTAYTHERRLRIAHALDHGVDGLPDLRVACAISEPALRRHLHKLARRRLATLAEGKWSPSAPPSGLAASLHAVVMADRR